MLCAIKVYVKLTGLRINFMHIGMQKTLLLFFFYIYATPVFAFSMYADASYMYHSIDTGGVELNPYTAKLKFGVPITKTMSIEAVYASAAGGDKVNGLEVEIDEILAAYVRFYSSMKGGGTHISLFVGQANTTLVTSGSGSVGSEDFQDLSWGIGAEEESKAIKNLFYILEYPRYYDDDDLTVSGTSLGVKYNF